MIYGMTLHFLHFFSKKMLTSDSKTFSKHTLSTFFNKFLSILIGAPCCLPNRHQFASIIMSKHTTRITLLDLSRSG